MTSNIQPQKSKIIIKTPLNQMNKNPIVWEHFMFITEYELETHVSRFFQKIAIENTLPEEAEIVNSKIVSKIPKKKA